MEPKLFSLDEANRLVPKVQELMGQVQQAARDMREAEAQVSVLVQQHGEEKIDQAGNPDREQYWATVAKGREAEERLHGLLDEVRFLGAEIKDLDLGLVDFRTRRDGETVYLCWRLGEDRIRFWHDLRSGFAGRKPIEELQQQRR